MLKKNSEKRSSAKGMTLVELLISLTIFLIGISAIYGVLRLATIQKNTVNSRTDQLRSARIALEYIRRDALDAGYNYHRVGGIMPDNTGNAMFGIPIDGDPERDTLTSVIAGNQINTNALNFGGRTDVAAFISRDQAFNNGALIRYTETDKSSGNNGVKIMNTDPATPNAFANCNKYEIYLFESTTTQVIGMVTSKPTNDSLILATGSEDSFGLNQPPNGNSDTQSLLITAATSGTMKRLNIVSYSVTNDGVLVRTKFGNVAGTAAQQRDTRELVYGVSDFQIKYYMEDGTTIDDPSNSNNGRTNQQRMNDVVQIQISITLASDASDGQPKVTTPVVIKEFISTKNLHYESSY